MDLEQFRTHLSRELADFVTFWRRDHSIDPETYPLTLTFEEWLEHFMERFQ